MSEKSGRIVTFYSYKGGTGRTMALSNVAWILASNGYDVLLIDWDLEAPGLHRYLRPFLVDRDLVDTPGLIDFVWDCAQVCMTPPPPDDDQTTGPEFPSLDDYVVGLSWDFGERGSISFIPAGQQDENYAQRVNTFNWDHFYERLGGGKLLETQRERLRANYDYVLIDSRTGVSDTSSICTVQMPDILVVFFTLNRQSIDGTAAVASSVTSAVKALRNEALRIFPVPTRIENAETDKRDAAIEYSRDKFKSFLFHVQPHPEEIDPREQTSYWNEVETPYRTFYAFEEVPAAFKDEPGSLSTLLAANERIAYWITDRVVSSLLPANEKRRKEVVEAYAFTADKVLSFERAPSSGRARRFFRRLILLVQNWLRGQQWRFVAVIVAVMAALVTLLLSTRSELLITRSDLSTVRSVRDELTRQMTDAQGRISAASEAFTVASNSLRRVIRSLEPPPARTRLNSPIRSRILTRPNMLTRLNTTKDQLDEAKKQLGHSP